MQKNGSKGEAEEKRHVNIANKKVNGRLDSMPNNKIKCEYIK